jgi:putative GTP pyrophosphokinase
MKMSEYGFEIIEKEIKKRLLDVLTKSGLLFRIFSRVKESQSIEEKIERKKYSESRKMQDLIGFRITSYFNDDIPIVVKICESLFEVVELVYDTPSSEVFKPSRLNMICRMPKSESNIFDSIKNLNDQYKLLDNTFEIQFRTTLSEGWHEVEHLMRYKCKADWEHIPTEGRMLNGIYATLETSDHALKSIFDDLSYHHYKEKKWEAMLRNKFRLRFRQEPLSIEYNEFLNSNIEFSRRIYKIERSDIINSYINSQARFPLTFNNFILFINFIQIKNEQLLSMTSQVLLEEFGTEFKDI